MTTTTAAMSPWAHSIYRAKYSLDGKEEWPDTAHRVATNVMGAIDAPESLTRQIEQYIVERKFLPGGRYLYAAGRGLHQVNNCLLLKAEDSREGWADLMHKASMALMTGAGIGVDYSEVRGKGAPIHKTGGLASGPLSLMEIINEIGRRVMQGGSRRSAIWAGLNWQHPDIFDFIRSKDWSEEVRTLKLKDFNFPATMDMTNVSVQLDDDFFAAINNANHSLHSHAREVYGLTVRRMLKTAEPGFSIDVGTNAGETLRNACTEVSSYDDSDVCNLGSLNLAAIESLAEMRAVTEAATYFLLAGTVYSHLPYDKVGQVREKNRRLGLGLMGIHEWLLKRNKHYGPDEELGHWLNEYTQSDAFATKYADMHGLSRPVKTRAVAPTGTIGIIGETTTGIEPIFCAAYKRRYLASGTDWKYQFVVDPTAKRLIEAGVAAHNIEDAYSLAYDVERRVSFQAWVQQYVDHGISSTINLPYVMEGEEAQGFSQMLLGYLPQLRGVTVYPDGARGGQPLSPIDITTAMEYEGVVFETEEESCVGGVCGI